MESRQDDLPDVLEENDSFVEKKWQLTKDQEKEVLRDCEGVPIQEDYFNWYYRDLLNDYDGYMLYYESMAGCWENHYHNVQKSIDRALGLGEGGDLTAEEREKLKKVGCLAIFGSGCNPARELSPKLIQALAERDLELVLSDFSSRALTGAVNRLSQIGIEPKAAYQIDLTMGISGHLHEDVERFSQGVDYFANPGKIDVFFSRLENQMDSLLKIHEEGGKMPDFVFDHYSIKEKESIGLAVSTMLAAATFLTVYGKLFDLINKNFGHLDSSQRFSQRLKQLHAKYNAFILKFSSTNISELCGDNADVLVVSDVNKVSLPSPDRLGLKNVRPNNQLKVIYEKIRAAVDAVVSMSDDATESDLISTVDFETRIGSDGSTEESVEKVLSSMTAMKGRIFTPVLSGNPMQWVWWDELMISEDNYGHGHKVQTSHFKLKKP